MSRMLSSVAALLLAIFVGLYLRISPILNAAGVWRTVEAVGDGDCKTFPQLQACEKVVLHQPTGLVYLACSTLHSRSQWTPVLDRLNAAGMSETDYVATYDPKTDAINRLQFSGLPSRGPISLHGMDVVASSEDPSILYVYLVNHRKPETGDPRKVGADSVIELFKTQIGSNTLEHVRAFQDLSVVVTPNDVVGSPDGKSCHFTNDHGQKTGLPSDASVGFCDVDEGCKFAYTGLHASNGIVKGLNDTFYVVDCLLGDITVLENQFDNTLALIEVISTGQELILYGRSSDNLAIDANGALWVAANRGLGSFYGEKYNVDKVYRGIRGRWRTGIGSTSAVYDAERGLLFMHGV
ncbi:hypothetical protein BU15DRAFT_85756 [Melanogaster broomeanus]|nr:hypothetical protein BU15DRAFT_85756 [Melanogaster broomeanus]